MIELLRRAEARFWSAIAFLAIISVPLGLALGLTRNWRDFEGVITAMMVALLAHVFRLVFDRYPITAMALIFEYLHKWRHIQKSRRMPEESHKHLVSEALSDSVVADATSQQNILLSYAISSRSLAKGMYGRAGAYLLIGVMVAFSGLLFFYSQSVIVNSSDVNTLLFTLAPKLGILFFIEIVAFFFLKQYRAAMDEFRYYEAVARTREEVVALLEIAKESGKPLDIMELIKHDSYFSKGNTLSKGQTTEIIETRKLERSELDVLEKIVAGIVNPKK